MTRRIPMPAGTRLELKENTIYEIIGEPIGFGGSSILYNAIRILSDGTHSGIMYTIKECYPVSSFSDTSFIRNENGEIIPSNSSERSGILLKAAKRSILNEEKISQDIYKTAMRMIPILEKSDVERVTFPNGESHIINNALTVMESLSGKGRSIHDHLVDEGHLSPVISFQIIQQVLVALKEMHTAERPYIHLDIQDANIFLHGTLGDENELVTLIDFGSAKPLHNGKTAELDIWTLFSTEGFTAPEIIECIKNNEDHITLFPSADIYSVGCLLYLLLIGKKPEHATISSNPDAPLSGKELRRLKKDGFPPHLENKLQSTLARTLASGPSDRYQSVDEMLSDIRIISEALESRRDPIDAMEYDAFICYKHGALDTAAALRLQKNLESFRPPMGISKKKHPFRNVFVDEGELASCPDMGAAIHTALKNSRYLIVICSPDTPVSKWVDKEIKEFSELHGRDRILAVIISGDRDSSFPDGLKGTDDAVGEVLAASAIGKNRRAVLRNLGLDALLKIASAMLGVTYDSLKQRKKIHVFRNITMISVSMAVLLSLFFMYVLYQSHLIREQYLKTQISQARRMTDVSSELWKNGDKTGALATALAVRSEDDPDVPVVPEQMYALNTALSSYKTGRSLAYSPAYSGAVHNISTACLSDDSKYLYVIDDNNRAYVLSGDKGELLWEIDLEEIQKAGDPYALYDVHESFNEFTHIIPYTDDEFIVTLSHCVAILRVSSKSVERIVAVEPSISKNYPPKVAGGRIVIQSGSNEGIYIYNLLNGELIDKFTSLTENNETRYTINDIALSPDGRFLAIGAGGLVIYDIENRNERKLSLKETEKVIFGNDTRLIAIFSEPPSDVESVNGAFGVSNYSYTFGVFDALTSKNLYMSSGRDYYGISPSISQLSFSLNKENHFALAVWFGGDLYLVDPISASVTFQYNFIDNIVSVQALDSNRIIVALEEGTVYSATIATDVVTVNILELTDINDCIYNRTDDELIIIRDGKSVFCDNSPDTDMTFVKTEDIMGNGWKLYSEFYDNIGDTVYRLIRYKADDSYHASAFAVFEIGTSEPIYVFKSRNKNSDIYNIELGNKNDITYLAFIEYGEDKKPILNKVNLTSGDNIITADMSEYDTLIFDMLHSVAYSADMTSLFVVRRRGGVVEFDISGDMAIPQKEAIMKNIRTDYHIYTDYQNRYLLILNKNIQYIYDINTKETKEKSLSNVFDSSSDSLNVQMGKSSPYACIYDKNHTVCIVDIQKNEVVCIIQSKSNDSNWGINFFDDDRYLIVKDNKSIAIYETTSGNMLSKQEDLRSASIGDFIISDHSSSFFAINSNFLGASVQSGLTPRSLLVFYVDPKHRIHTWAEIDNGYFSPLGREILVEVSDGFFYGGLKDYQCLMTYALQALDGITLTNEQKENYYLTD